MRFLLALAAASLVITCASVSHADPDSLWNAELRIGYGLEVASGDGMAAPRSAPLTLEAMAAVAFQDDPRLYGYGGFIVETLDRGSFGGVGGVELEHGKFRFRLGGVGMVRPLTLWGGAASGGMCHRMSGAVRVCGDLALTEYFAGDDLVKGHSETQVQFVFALVIDGT